MAGLVVFLACGPQPITPGSDILVGGVITVRGSEVVDAFVPSFQTTGPLGTVTVPASMIYVFNNTGVFSSTYATTPTPWTSTGLTFAPLQSLIFGDPQVAAFPSGGLVVISTLGGSPGTTAPGFGPDQVVIWVSTNGGASFGTGVVVNTSSTCGSSGTATSVGAPVDQQTMAFDPSDPAPAIYLAWRFNGGATQLNSNFGACMRGGHINPTTGAITWIRAETPVQNVQTQFTHGVGGLIVLPSNNGPGGVGTGKGVTIVYNDTDDFFENCPVTAQMKWFSVSTVDTGQSWGSSTQILDSPTYAPCTVGNRYGRELRGTFGATRDSAGNLWAAVSDTQNSAQIFTSSTEGTTWSLDQTAFFPGLFFPTMQVDDAGRVALFFYGATGAAGSTTTPFLMDRRAPTSAVLPGVWTEPVQCGNTFNSAVLTSCFHDSNCPGVFAGETNGHCVGGQCVITRGLGDYEGMAFVPTASGLGLEASSVNQWAPVWTSQAVAAAGGGTLFGPNLHTSFNGANQ